MELHQNVDKFLHLREKVVENSRLAPQFLPSQLPNLPDRQPRRGGLSTDWGGQSIGLCGILDWQ